MNQDIEDLIRDIWQSENPIRRAKELDQALQHDSQTVIREIFRNIRARAAARSSLSTSSSARIAENGPAPVENHSSQQSLLLLYFAMYDADSILDISQDSRERCLKSWAEQTGFPIEVVRETVILGQNGLKSLIATTSPSYG